MKLTGFALRLQILVGEDDMWHHKPVYHEIVRRAREAGLAGATVLRGCEGFGGHSVIHTTRLLDMTEDLPVVVIVVDTEDRIHGFLPQLDDIITDGTVLLDEVHVIHYQAKAPS
jgi:PII-like signaling protein